MDRWKNKQHIFFGLNGTLLDLHFDNHFWQEIVPQAYAKLYALNIDQAKALLSSYLASAAGTNDIYSIEYWEKKLGINILNLKKQHSDLIRLNKYVEKFLFYINNLNPKPACHLVSNYHPDIIHYKIKLTGIDYFFDSVTSSYSFNMLKQDEQFWEYYLKQLRINPDQAVLLDNNLSISKIVSNLGLEVIAISDFLSENQLDQKITCIKNLADLLPDRLSNLI
ncbi:MAG: hypothetical protein KBD64_00045 [Gammaproteobacteria bacterium]|nr:hypothetical protein [Gammaproteobacteria bacterium]